MARIAGVDLPREKRVEIGLTYIYGIGRPTSLAILEKAGIKYSVFDSVQPNPTIYTVEDALKMYKETGKKSVHCSLRAGKKVTDPLPQSSRFGSVRRPFHVDPPAGSRLSFLQGLQIHAQIRHTKYRQTGLAGTKEITGAAHLQILLRDLKTVRCLAEGLQPLEGITVFVVRS